ncbi:hypothetical protein HW115_13710 [Verrucomicrobiaceae bacterium N1E253]|uniref:Uncharacterized protein n=1 Tax=Oceaniferula marina TaxID=2748318 RepID=A0A851GR46_9BACT|nr:hypothetical protein [Oceaniferula marina]NWK56674.1 hypothetical protein [Oceaniferula marina]
MERTFILSIQSTNNKTVAEGVVETGKGSGSGLNHQGTKDRVALIATLAHHLFPNKNKMTKAYNKSTIFYRKASFLLPLSKFNKVRIRWVALNHYTPTPDPHRSSLPSFSMKDKTMDYFSIKPAQSA